MKKECSCGKHCKRIIQKTRSVGFTSMIMKGIQHECDFKSKVLIGYDPGVTAEILKKVELLYEQKV